MAIPAVIVYTVGMSVPDSTPAPLAPPCTSTMSPIPTPSPCTPCAPPESVIVYRDVPGPERIVYRDKIVEKFVQVNHTVEKMVEKIVHVDVPGPERIVEVPGPERIVYRDKIVEKFVQVNHTVEKMVEVPKVMYVNRTEEKIVELPKIIYVNRTEEKIVYVQVPGPERIVYTDKIVEKLVQVNHTVEKMVEVPKSIFVEKNLTEGTLCTCKAGYYASTAGFASERGSGEGSSHHQPSLAELPYL